MTPSFSSQSRARWWATVLGTLAVLACLVAALRLLTGPAPAAKPADPVLMSTAAAAEVIATPAAPGQARPRAGDPASQASARTAAARPPAASTAPSPSSTVTSEVYRPEFDGQAAADVAARFVDAWYAGGSRDAWLGAVSRWADPTLLDQLTDFDPTRLPGDRRVDPALVQSLEPGVATIQVPTDATPIMLTVIYTADGWRVAELRA